MTPTRILIVDDDEIIRDILTERLARKGFEIECARTLAEAREIIKRTLPDVALLDIRLPDGQGTELLEELAGEAEVPCIMMTAHATVESAVEALKLGAEDYLEKPFTLDRVEATLAHTLERNRLRLQVRRLRSESQLTGTVIGSSDAMRAVLKLTRQIAAASRSTVLIEGETGSGKGMIARAIHDLSPRSAGPFVHVTCPSLAEGVLESELFGHEKGAFTDARTKKRGLVEVAHGGTLFLDEIGEISVGVQGKLLRFIEDKVFRRVGGTEDLRVDVRVIAATNRDLMVESEQGRFRTDLYYRLRVLPIELPPLRHRRSDIPELAATFLDRFNGEFGKHIEGFSDETLRVFQRYEWPGNVRQLCNVVERAVLLSEHDEINVNTLPPELHEAHRGGSGTHGLSLGPEGIDLKELERNLLVEALRRSEGNRTEAGRLLGLSRHQIRNRLTKYGVEP